MVCVPPGCTCIVVAPGVALPPGSVVEAVRVRFLAPSPPPSLYLTGNETVAVPPWPAVALEPPSTPKSLTGLERSAGKFGGVLVGESAQSVVPVQVTGLPDSVESLSARRPAVIRYLSGPGKGPPSAAGGRPNSACAPNERSSGSVAGSRLFLKPEMYPTQCWPGTALYLAVSSFV